MFLCGRTVRARALREGTARSLPVQRLQFPPRLRFPPRTLTCGLPACVRACVRSPHQHNVQSPLSSRRCRTSTCPRPRASVLSPACASVVHMCDSVCGEIAITSSSGVPKVSTVREPLSEEYRSCCCLISRAEEKTCADVDVHVCKQRETII